MTVEEFSEQIEFALSACKLNGSVKVIVEVAKRKVVLDIKEIGFNDKEGIVYIEAAD